MIESYVLIIGAMKSGTTTLFDLLSQHPAISPSQEKEAGFFAFPDRWAEGFEWYESLFAFDPSRHRYALEASSDYSKHPFATGVRERLAASAPRRFKLIYVMRHPLRRIESHAQHVQISRAELGTSRSLRPDHGLDAGVSPVSLAVSRYAEQLDQYRSYFDRGDLLLLSFEDLICNQQQTFDRVCDFLEIDRRRAAAAHSLPAGVRRRRPWYWDLARRTGPLAGIVKAAVPPERRRELLRQLSWTKVHAEGRFTLNPEEERRLLDALSPDLARLSGEYGFDVAGKWGLATGDPAGAAAAADTRPSLTGA